jgi:Tfp pilus assembly protein PilV
MDRPTNPPLKVARPQRLGLYATVILVVFLIGFVPMWLRARTLANERDAAQQAARLTQLENTLASAAIHARRGDYEPAREAASTFYTNVRAELDSPQSVLSASQRDMLQPILAQRDQTITLLARADPAVAERLADAYLSYRRAMGTLASPSAGQQP